jgi:phenylacetate-CoA ligase
MERVTGRTDDMIIVCGVNVFSSQIESVLLRAGEIEPQYEIIVDRTADHMDELDVLVEAPAQIYGDQQRLVQFEKRLSDDVQSALGITSRDTSLPILNDLTFLM